MKKWLSPILVTAFVILFITSGASALVLTSDGIAFSDFDLNDDGQVTIDDLNLIQSIVDQYGSIQVPLPNVSKFDLNLDGYIDSEDVEVAENYMGYNAGTFSVTVGINTTNLGVGGKQFRFMYTQDLDDLLQWFEHYIPVSYHEYHDCSSGFQYMCGDFSADTYWLFIKNFLKGHLVVNNITYLPPISEGYSSVHGFNWILTSPDWQDPNSWVLLEPQSGVTFTINEILQNNYLKETYLYEKREIRMYYAILDIETGEDYTLVIGIDPINNTVTKLEYSDYFWDHFGTPPNPYNGIELDHVVYDCP